MSDETRFDQSFKASVHYLKRASGFLRWIKVLGTVFGAVLIASSPWIEGTSHADAQRLSDLALWIGIVLTVFGSVILIFVDQTTPEVLSENLQLARQQDVLEENFRFLLGYIEHTLSRLSLDSYLREIIESAVTDGCESVEKLRMYSDTVLSLLVERKLSLFKIEDENWNFAVYRYEPSKGVLECLACRRAGDLPDGHVHRDWPPGEGHVGLAFSRSAELIFADASREELRPVIGAKGDRERDYDEERYRSLAAMPISSDGLTPLGILIATSDTEGRFKNEGERDEEDWEREDVLREVAAYLAILFKLIQNDIEARGSSNVEETNAPNCDPS